MFTIADILDVAVQLEKNGSKVYRQAMEQVSDPDLMSMLQWLAEEEEAHIRWFQEMRQLTKGVHTNPDLEELGRRMLRDAVGESAFSLQDKDIPAMEQVRELVDTALEFERDTVLFYEMIASVVEKEETRLQLNQVIEEEKQHVRKLQDFLDANAVSAASG